MKTHQQEQETLAQQQHVLNTLRTYRDNAAQLLYIAEDPMEVRCREWQLRFWKRKLEEYKAALSISSSLLS